MKSIYAACLLMMCIISTPVLAFSTSSIKVWFTIHDNPSCPIDTSQTIAHLVALKNMVQSPDLELWIDGQPKGLTIRLTAITKLVEEVCFVQTTYSLLDFANSGGFNRPNIVSIYSPQIPLFSGVKYRPEKEELKSELTEKVKASWQVGLHHTINASKMMTE